MWRKGNPSVLLVGMQTGAALWKTVWNFLKKLKMDLTFDSVILLLGIYPKKPKISNSKECMNYIHSSTIYNSQDLETA